MPSMAKVSVMDYDQNPQMENPKTIHVSESDHEKMNSSKEDGVNKKYSLNYTFDSTYTTKSEHEFPECDSNHMQGEINRSSNGYDVHLIPKFEKNLMPSLEEKQAAKICWLKCKIKLLELFNTLKVKMRD